MSVVSQSYRDWLAGFPKEPSDRMAIALAAVDAFDRGERLPTLTVEDLRPLVAAASSPHKLVFETGASLLARLAETHFAAQQCFRLMSQDRNATARFHAVAYLTAKLPEDLRLEIVSRALTDRSARVRTKAVERAEDFQFKQLLPRLEEMLRTETHAGVRGSLDLHLPLLRDGYRLKPGEDGGGWLTVSVPGEHLTTRYVPAERCSGERLQQEIVRLRKALP